MKTRTVLNVPGGMVMHEQPCTPRGTDAYRQLRAELAALAAIDEAIDSLDSLEAGEMTTFDPCPADPMTEFERMTDAVRLHFDQDVPPIYRA